MRNEVIIFKTAEERENYPIQCTFALFWNEKVFIFVIMTSCYTSVTYPFVIEKQKRPFQSNKKYIKMMKTTIKMVTKMMMLKGYCKC